jgi:septal ring factor EnvC (AmiA/AmiB activator)
MSKDDLKKQVRVLAHELQLSTYINKGAISESTDLKVRVAELERQNTALRAAETRLTATEEKLEEQEEEIKEKEAQIKRLKESLCGMRESLRNMTRQRDTWTHRWDRMKNMIKKEDAELEESDTEPPTDFPTVS